MPKSPDPLPLRDAVPTVLGLLALLTVALAAALPARTMAAAFLPDADQKLAISAEEREQINRLLTTQKLRFDHRGRRIVMIDDQKFDAAQLQKTGFLGRRWTNALVPYSFSSEINTERRALFREYARAWEEVSDVRFVEDATARNRLYVVRETDENSCGTSWVGMIGGAQELSIGDECWDDATTVIHELGHALGLWHEHQRSDRDTYIALFEYQICEGYEHNFDKYTGTINYGKYDYRSIMHYHSRAFGKPMVDEVCTQQEKTLQPWEPHGDKDDDLINLELSELDAIGMARHYQTHPLTITKTGNGRITSEPSGIDCGEICQESFFENETVQLTAHPAYEYRLASWGGACSGSGKTCSVSMDEARSVTANFAAESRVSLRFDSSDGPTSKTISRGSEEPVTFAWSTQALPPDATCRIMLQPNDEFRVPVSPVAGGTLTNTSIHQWGTGTHRFYLRCSDGSSSPTIKLTIQPGASLRFDSADGPDSKSIVRNAGEVVTFAWKTYSLPSSTTCRIMLRPKDEFRASASPVAGGTLEKTSIHKWGFGAHVFYLKCSDGTTSPDITLSIRATADETVDARLRFDSIDGPEEKDIERNSGAPVIFAWQTRSLPPDASCRIMLRPKDEFRASVSPVSGGTLEKTSIHKWGIGTHVFYLKCSDGTTSPDIKLNIQASGTGSATAQLWFDSTDGPMEKDIERNSGDVVTFAWQTRSLPPGASCRIMLRPDDRFRATAAPVSEGTLEKTSIHTWGVGTYVFYLKCSNGTTSPDVRLDVRAGTGSLADALLQHGLDDLIRPGRNPAPPVPARVPGSLDLASA